MRSIKVDNPALNSYSSDVAEDYASGTDLIVRSNNSFAASDLIVVGNPSEELTELKKLNGISGNTHLTLASTLKFEHNKGTPIYKSIWDFIRIEADYGLGWNEITQSPIQWDNNENKTIYFDPNGTDTTKYRFRFYNSATLVYSEYSPTLLGIGFTKYQMGYIIKEARREAGDKTGKIMTTDECLRALTRAKNIIRAHNARYWFWKVRGYHSGKSIVAVAGDRIFDLSSITDMGVIDSVEMRYTQGGGDRKWTLRPKSDVEFDGLTGDLNRPARDQSRFFRFLPPDASSLKGYFEIENQIQNSGVVIMYPNYYKEEPDYNSVDDTTAVIMPEILQDYLIYQIYETKGNETEGKKYYKRFTGPENREKTQALDDLTGIALLDALDMQYKYPAGSPKSLVKYRGQKAVTRLYGNSMPTSPDYLKENFFRNER